MEMNYGNSPQAAIDLNEKLRSLKNEYDRILKRTLTIDDKIDWDKLFIKKTYEDFNYNLPLPIKEVNSTKSLFSGLVNKLTEQKKAEKYEQLCIEYEETKKKALIEYIKNRIAFEDEKRKCNTETAFLKYHFEKAEKTAVEKYCNMVLLSSKYPKNLVLKHKVNFSKLEKIMVVNFLLPKIEEFPIEEEFFFDGQKVVAKFMDSLSSKALYERTLLSVGVRTIHELFEALYTDSVESIIFNGYVRTSVYDTKPEKVDFSINVRCIFAVKAFRKDFESIDLTSNEVEKIMTSLNIIKIKNFSDTWQLMAPLKSHNN